MFDFIFLTIFISLFSYFTWYKFQNALILFFLLLPSYLIRFQIGFLPTTLLEIMFGIIFVIWILKYGRTMIYSLWSIIKKYPVLFIGILLFLLAATISVFTSTNTRFALGEWKAFYIEPVIMFIILITSIKEKKDINKIIFALVLSGLITSILAIYQHFTGWLVPEAFWSNRNTYRVTAWYGFPNGVGLFLAPLIPLAIYEIKQILTIKNKNNTKVLFFIPYSLFLILSPLTIIFSKGTGPLLGVLGGIGLLLLLNKKTRWSTLILGFISLISLLFLPQLSGIRQELLFQDRSGQIRLAIYNETGNFLKDNPLTGAGLASYSEKIAPYHTTVNNEKIEIFHHPHNIFLTMWVNLGILGVISFITITFYSLFFLPYYFYKQKKQIPNILLYITSSLFIVMIMGLVDSPYIKNDLAFFFWLLLGLIITTNDKNKISA